jgi:hypothetical protein
MISENLITAQQFILNEKEEKKGQKSYNTEELILFNIILEKPFIYE